MSSVVVHNDMHLESGTNLVLDDIEELPGFQGAMPALVNVFIKLDILTIDGTFSSPDSTTPCPLKVTRGAVASCPWHPSEDATGRISHEIQSPPDTKRQGSHHLRIYTSRDFIDSISLSSKPAHLSFLRFFTVEASHDGFANQRH